MLKRDKVSSAIFVNHNYLHSLNPNSLHSERTQNFGGQ